MPSSAKILALHTTTDELQISIGNPDQQETITALVGRDMGKYLHTYLARAVGNEWHTLTAVVVHTGAGSQTGKRIGLAVGQTIAGQLGIPLYTVEDADSSADLLRRASRPMPPA